MGTFVKMMVVMGILPCYPQGKVEEIGAWKRGPAPSSEYSPCTLE